jgi:DNA (cytosine-5)-methyltransferase 1
VTVAVDLFAGGGGSAEGLAQAGLTVAWAGNHDRDALAVHRANHPGTVHVQQDLQQARWHDVPAHDLLWASPACQGHSQCATHGLAAGRRGTAPAHDELRSTAWAAVAAAEVHRPAHVVVENVVEFRRWVLYPAWLSALRALGYALSENVVDAADLGVPQDRTRLFVVGVRGRGPLTLPEPRCAPSDRRVGWDVVELDAGRWRPAEEAQPVQQSRIRRAIEAHGDEGAVLIRAITDNPFRSLSRPLPTITTKCQMGLAKRDGASWLYRPFLGSEYARGMGFPDEYDWLDNGVTAIGRMAGNAVVPAVAKWIAGEVLQ